MWRPRNPSPPKGIDWGDSDDISSAAVGGNEPEPATLLPPCTNSVALLNAPSIGRSIKTRGALSIKVSVATRTRKAKFSAQVKKDRAPGLEPIIQKEYGCTTAVARIFSTFSHLRDGVIGTESNKWGLS